VAVDDLLHLATIVTDWMLRDHGVDVESRQTARPLGMQARSGLAVSIQVLGLFRITRRELPVSVAWEVKKARDLLKI
jgi:hypothetical protein